MVQQSSFVKGKFYEIEGRYLEYDGKIFGMGSMEIEVPEFTGPRNISSLACYPLKYHKDAEKLKEQLVERGKKFVSLKGMQYRFHKGMAFYKKKRQVIKVNINGRVMIDPAIHRRINPNYPISTVKPMDPDLLDDEDEEDSDSCNHQSSSDEEGLGQKVRDQFGETDKPITKWKVVEDDDGNLQVVQIEVDSAGNAIQKEDMNKLPGQDDDSKDPEFTEEDLLIASPVALGFAFSEKLWLEISVSGIKEIEWNEGAYDSLVLPDNQKAIVKGLVRSHTFEGSHNIDDVIQGKFISQDVTRKLLIVVQARVRVLLQVFGSFTPYAALMLTWSCQKVMHGPPGRPIPVLTVHPGPVNPQTKSFRRYWQDIDSRGNC